MDVLQAFFDCLKEKADSCNVNPTEENAKLSIEEQNFIEKRKKRKEKKHLKEANISVKELGLKFKHKLADTIWASRVCIFRQN